jgi:hypothetical protein
MANTDVVLRDELGLRVPSIPKVTIVASDTVTFTAEKGANSALYFAPETASILSPRPGNPVHLSLGHALTYTFEASTPGAFGVITQAPGDPAPEAFSFGEPASPPVLVIQAGKGLDFPGPTNDPQG